MSQLDELGARVRAAFERVHRDVFLCDPVANARLTVDVVDAAAVDDALVLVLVTPWTVNGLVFPPGDDFPESLEIAGRRRPVFRMELAGVGVLRSVNLPVQTAVLHSMSQARTLARSWIPALHQAVRTARAPRAQSDRSDSPAAAVAEPGRSARW